MNPHPALYQRPEPPQGYVWTNREPLPDAPAYGRPDPLWLRVLAAVMMALAVVAIVVCVALLIP